MDLYPNFLGALVLDLWPNKKGLSVILCFWVLVAMPTPDHEPNHLIPSFLTLTKVLFMNRMCTFWGVSTLHYSVPPVFCWIEVLMKRLHDVLGLHIIAHQKSVW